MRLIPSKAGALLLAGSLAVGLAACGSGSSGGGPSGTTAAGTSTKLSGTLTVFAAASLNATFSQLATEFESENPGTTVRLSFAGSSDLVTQISQGAPADVFASADSKNMAKLTAASLVAGKPTDFATNVLEIAVPPSNPAGIASFTDLARPGTKVVVCAPQVPCGSATQSVEKLSNITLKPVSEEGSVTDVLGKVESGEADAGLVYVTDVKAAGDKVKGIPFPESAKAVNTYPIATVETSKNKDLAAAFTALVTGSQGRKVLGDAGFGAP